MGVAANMHPPFGLSMAQYPVISPQPRFDTSPSLTPQETQPAHSYHPPLVLPIEMQDMVDCS